MGVPPIETTRAALLKAWHEWDDAPSHLGNATALERAFDAHGAHFGIRKSPFRDICIAFRRANFTREQTLAAIEAGITGART